MFKFDENYYLRKYFLAKNDVPTQSQMKEKMCVSLANVYFKSMSYRLKVLAGLEPPLRGGGSDWYVPPKDILNMEVALKPIKKEYLKKLGFAGIDELGAKACIDFKKALKGKKERTLLENDEKWRQYIEQTCHEEWSENSRKLAKYNSENIRNAFGEFEMLYATSINKLEQLLVSTCLQNTEQVRDLTYTKMKLLYQRLLKKQATMLYDRYRNRVLQEKTELKMKFSESVQKERIDTLNRIHDIHAEKQIAIGKLRNLLECQNLACQAYIALKEREYCEKEINEIKDQHKEQMKDISENIALKKLEIDIEKKKYQQRTVFNDIWKLKVTHIVKKFKMFVSFCLQTLPEHADFFLNMEKLMLIQLNESMNNPSCESIFVEETESVMDLSPKPKPFIIYGDLTRKVVNEKLCPKRKVSSEMPVIVINKRYIYAACDNFELFTDKLRRFTAGQRGDELDFDDDYPYSDALPIIYSRSQQLTDLKLESSMMQMLQNEFVNINNANTQCDCICKLRHCFCSPLHSSQISLPKDAEPKPATLIPKPVTLLGKKISNKEVELKYERGPRLERYAEFVKPIKCKCSLRVKKGLKEHLPPYMLMTSKYEHMELPNYEPCSLKTIRHLISKKHKPHLCVITPVEVVSKFKDVATQFSDIEFENLCTCFSSDEFNKLYDEIVNKIKVKDLGPYNKFQVMDGSITASHLSKFASDFAVDQAHSLINLLDSAPQLKEIFKKNN